VKKYLKWPTLLDIEKYFDIIGPTFLQLGVFALVIHAFKDMGIMDVIIFVGAGLFCAFVSGILQVVREMRDERKGTTD